MARCAICDKGAHFGNNVSHSHRRICKSEDRKRKCKENVCLYFLLKKRQGRKSIRMKRIIKRDIA